MTGVEDGVRVVGVEVDCGCVLEVFVADNDDDD